MPSKKYTGLCAFCTFKGKLTKEHIFSDWLGKYIPKEQQRFQSIIRRDSTGRVKIQTKKVSGAMHTRRDPIVCQKCNKEWMKDIVDASMPVEIKIMFGSGQDMELTTDEIRALREK